MRRARPIRVNVHEMSARWLIAGALLAALIASAAVIFSGGSAPDGAREPARAGAVADDEGAAGGSGAAAEKARALRGRVPPPPVRMRSSGGGPPAPDPFAEEARDPRWAAAKEKLVKDTVLPLLEDGVDVDRIECRSRRCRLAVSGTDKAAFERFVESLQDERGFLGIADQLMLRNLSRKDGTASVDVDLVFKPDEN